MQSEPLLKDEFARFEKTLNEDIAEIKNNQEKIMSIIGDTKTLLIRIENIKEHHELCRIKNEKEHDDFRQALAEKISYNNIKLFNGILVVIVIIINFIFMIIKQ